MKKFAIIAGILGVIGVALGAFGAHSLKAKLSAYHLGAYKVGVQYLFYHLAPLLFLATQKKDKFLKVAGYILFIGIICFTSSNCLMTTETVHGISFRWMWPITPIGGVLMMVFWGMIAFHYGKRK